MLTRNFQFIKYHNITYKLKLPKSRVNAVKGTERQNEFLSITSENILWKSVHLSIRNLYIILPSSPTPWYSFK